MQLGNIDNADVFICRIVCFQCKIRAGEHIHISILFRTCGFVLTGDADHQRLMMESAVHTQFTADTAQSLNLNTQVEVLEELKCCYAVSVNDTIGCMAKDQVGTNRYATGGGGGGGDWTPPAM